MNDKDKDISEKLIEAFEALYPDEKENKKEKKCECGSSSVNSPKHSYYCPLYQEDK